MSNIRLVCLLGFMLWLTSICSFARSPCPTQVLQGTNAKQSGDLICLIPQVYGAGGLVGTDNGGPLNPTTGHEVHFQASSVSTFAPINSEIGAQLSQLPLASPASGFLFTFQGGIVQLASAESFGPILTDRAETIGRHKLFVGFSYQFFNFDRADGVNLKNFGAVFTHEPEPTVCTTQPSVPCVNGMPIYTHDIVATQNRIDLKANQYTIVGTFGLTDKLDLSLAIPILNVRMNMYSSAAIYNFEPPPVNHSFAVPSPNPGSATFVSQFGALFKNSSSATGIGDLVFRAKYKAWQGEKSAVAVGLDIRFPTGDAYNFLGAGTWGVRPFVTYSRAGRISPHGTLGVQVNGSSVLAGDVTTQVPTTGKLSDIFTYSAGADFLAVQNRLSLTVDFIGQSLLDATRISETTYTDYGGNTHQNLATSTGTVTQANIALGGKYRPAGQFLIIANILFQVSNHGLHSKPVPLIGVTYTF